MDIELTMTIGDRTTKSDGSVVWYNASTAVELLTSETTSNSLKERAVNRAIQMIKLAPCREGC